MSISVSSDIKGVKELRALFTNMQKTASGAASGNSVPKILAKAANDMRTEWKRRIRDNKNIGATSLYYGTITVTNDMHTTDTVSYTVSSGVRYAACVEYGTSPHFPPYQALVKWVQVKIPLGKGRKTVSKERKNKRGMAKNALLAEAEGIAYLIARKISKHGTPAYPAFEPALDMIKKSLEDDMNKLWGQITK